MCTSRNGWELANELSVDMLRATGVCRDERRVDLHPRCGTKLDLGLLHCLANLLSDRAVLRKINTTFFLEPDRNMLEEGHIEILATQMNTAARRLALENTLNFLHFENADMEHIAANIVGGNNGGAVAMKTIS